MKGFSHFMQERVEITEAAAVTIVKGKRPNTWITSHGKYMISKCNEYRGYAPIGKKLYCIYDGSGASYEEDGGPEANLIRRVREGGQPDEVVDTLAKAKAMVMQWVKNETSHDFKDFKDPWAVMSSEDRKEANRLTIKILKTMPASPRQRELQAKRDAILKKYGIGQKKTVKEGVEQGDTPQPKPEYFRKPFNISGKIVQLHPVFDIPVKTKKYRNTRFRIGERDGKSPYVDTPGQKAYDAKMSVWRWRVRIQTDEGWMLMGYIGTADRKEGLPPIRLGDTVEVTNLKLSQMTGGNQMTYADSWVKGGYTTYTDKAVDYRSENFSRQLHGKVKRKAV